MIRAQILVVCKGCGEGVRGCHLAGVLKWSTKILLWKAHIFNSIVFFFYHVKSDTVRPLRPLCPGGSGAHQDSFFSFLPDSDHVWAFFGNWERDMLVWERENNVLAGWKGEKTKMLAPWALFNSRITGMSPCTQRVRLRQCESRYAGVRQSE